MALTVRTREDVTFILIFFIILAIIGLAAGGFIVRDYAHGRTSEAWPVVPGVVLSDLERADGPLRYAYSYRGQTYEARRIQVFNARVVRRQQINYRPGDIIDVYVNPEAPGFSLLRPGGVAESFLVFISLSGICIFLGLGGVVWTLSDGVENEEDAKTNAEG